jgi:hypothetical protein
LKDMLAQFTDNVTILQNTLAFEPNTPCESEATAIAKAMCDIMCNLEHEVGEVGNLRFSWEIETESDLQQAFACGLYCVMVHCGVFICIFRNLRKSRFSSLLSLPLQATT